MRATVSVIAAVILVQSAPALAIAPDRSGVDTLYLSVANPCTLTVHEDGLRTGCDGIEPESDAGLLLSASSRNAVAMMRAWRKRDVDSILPIVDPKPTGLQAFARARLLEDLRRELEFTFAIDGMLTEVVVLTTGGFGEVVVRNWMDRVVSLRHGKTRRTQEVATYRERWVKRDGRWVLGEFERPGIPRPSTPVSAIPARVPDPHLEDRPPTVPEFRRADCGCKEQGSFTIYDTEPRPIEKIQPSLPPDFEGDTEVKVVVHACVGADGLVCWAKGMKGPPRLLVAAIEAASQWVFQPASMEGVPRAVWVELPFEFHR